MEIFIHIKEITGYREQNVQILLSFSQNLHKYLLYSKEVWLLRGFESERQQDV